MTGRANAARIGREWLGKGYKKVGKGRWVSADGFKQMRFDGDHFNLELWLNQIAPKVSNINILNVHQYFKLFKTFFKIGGKFWWLF